jgi:basic membrane protein A
LLMKKGRAISTSVAAIIVIVIIVVAGGAYYYYTQVSTAPKKTIGVVFDIGGRGDLSFNDMAALGADNAAKTVLGCPDKPSDCEHFLQSSTSADYEPNLRQLASLNPPPVLIVAVGFLMGDAVNKTARAFPNQKFAIVDDVVGGLPNLLGLTFNTNEGGAAAGVLAAFVSDCYSKSGQGQNKVGLVLGIEIPVLWTFEIGYKWGVSWAENYSKATLGHSILGDAAVKNVVLYKYTGTFTDPAKGKAEALNQFNAGAVIAYNVAGATGNGIFDAASSLGSQKGQTMGPPFGIGVDSDQDYIAPGYVLASQMKRVDTAVLTATQLAVNGSFNSVVTKTGADLGFNMASGGVAMSTVADVNTFIQIAVSQGKSYNVTTVTHQIQAMRDAVTTKCGPVFDYMNTAISQIKSGAVHVPLVLTADAIAAWRSRYG